MNAKAKSVAAIDAQDIFELVMRRFSSLMAAGILALALPAFAQTTVFWGNPALVTPTVASTAGSASLTISGGSWAIGDIIQFTGTSALLNPFGTTKTRYYVVSVSGNTLQVASTPGGTPLNASNTTSASPTSQAQDWFTAANWSDSVPNSGYRALWRSRTPPGGRKCAFRRY